MARSISLAISLFICVLFAHSQTTKTVGGTGANYSTLQLAFAAINSGTIQGQIILQITGSTNEAASAILKASGVGAASYSSVIIYPTVSSTISTSGNWATIDLDGADNVTIDGRINQTGSVKSLFISGTSTGNGATTIRLLNSAENNDIKYCVISSSGPSSAMGIISFASSNSGNGNDNNIVEYCDLTNSGSRPYNAILSSGTAGRENSGNIIRNNNIFDTFQTGVSSNAININSASTGFTISSNSIYETTNFIPTNNALSYNPIRISTSSEHTITGNFIGGRSALCGGLPWTITANLTTYFCGIYAYAGTGTATKIENNTIANIDLTSTEDNPWDGIFLYSGNFDVTGNTIGGTTGTGSIVCRTPLAVATATMSGGVVTGINLIYGGIGYTTAPIITFSLSGSTTQATATAVVSAGVITGFTGLTGGAGYTSTPTVIFDGQSNNYSTSHGIINNSIGTVNLTGNNIGSITTVGSDYYSHGFESVYVRGASGTTTLSNNLIGSLTTANSIQVSSAAASSNLKQDVYGLYCNSASGTNIITGNTIANLTNNYSGLNPLSRTRGIAVIAGTNTIQNNTVRNLSTASKQSTGGSAASVIGITQSATTAGTIQTITGNTVNNLSNTNPNAKVYVSGIYYSGPISGSHTITGNFIHSLTISSSDNLSDIEGIELAGGVFICSNNIVNLGVNTSAGYLINGIWDESNSSLARSILFNSVYIGGTVSSGGSITAAFNNQYNTPTRDFRNNLFFNARSGGSGKHYAYYLKATGNASLTSDYNDYWATGTTGGVLAFVGSDKTTLSALQTATAGDVHSLNIDPAFALAGGTLASNYSTSASLPGASGTAITTDYSSLTRGSTPKMGALETNNYVWQGTTDTDYNTASNWLPAEVPPAGADITFAASPTHSCVLDQNRTVGNITNTTSFQIVTNGKQLTINKNLTFSGGAQINATSSSSTVTFAGTSAQNIPSGAFVNNIVDGLSLNNINGLTLNGDLTVQQALTLSSGVLTIGANTLILNDAIVKTSGSLTGGVTSNIIFGGSGSGTTLPAITVNNLTVNRSNGINLGGSVSVSGTLALSSGILTIGANTLTISGNSPTSVTGNINASNGSANLVFANASPITLPAPFFGGTAVNNMTISGAGGVIAGSDITVNGILNLAAANPSPTKGLLEMTINYTGYPGTSKSTYLNSHLLNMGPTATTIGVGDVTGTVKRTPIVANTPYAFGNQYTTISLTPGTMPTSLAVTITIGTSPNNTKKSDDIINDAVKRTYEIVPSSDGSNCFVTANFHYLESELTSSNSPFHVNSEQKLTTMDYDIEGGATASDEHGRANYDYTNNYIGLSSVPIDYFIQLPTHAWRTIFALRDFGENYLTWNGTKSTDWTDPLNWTLTYNGATAPNAASHIIIPDASTTLNDPILPSKTPTTINTISIENGGILAMGNSTLVIQNSFSGGWEDQNPLGNDPGTSTVIFNRKNTTISGNARFYNVEIASDGTDVADITNQTGNTMKIAGSISRTGLGTGKWYADIFDATIEYNGADQTVIHPDGTPDYHNLTLSGSGTKTLPANSLTLHGTFTLAGTASATANGPLSIGGNLSVGSGASFGTGAFAHIVVGEILCDGTITAASGSSVTCGSHFTNNGTFTGATSSNLSFNGSAIQTIGGTSVTTFGNVTIDNATGVKLTSDGLTTVSGNLTINASKKLELLAGKQLTVSGSISNSGGTAGFVIRSESDASSGTGSLINGSSGVNATIERWMTGDVWHLISPAATGGETVANYVGSGTQNSNLIARNATNYALAPYKTSDDSWDYYKVSGSNTSGNFGSPGTGLQVLRASGSGTGQGNNNDDGVVSFKGTLGAGNLTVALDKSGNRWNLIGNPYPCALNVTDFLTTNSSLIDPSFLFIYVSNIADITSYGYVPNTSGLKLSSGEGFFVKAKTGETSSSVNFTAAMKSHTSDPFKSSVIDYPGIKLFAESGSDKMSTSVNFINGMTNGLDPGWDAGLFNGGSVPFSLFTRLVEDNGVDFTIQCLPDNDYDNLVIPVGLVASKGSAVIFKANATNFNHKVYLEDRSTGVLTRLDDGSVYKVVMSEDSKGTGRFYLRTNQIVSAIPDDQSNIIKVIPSPLHHLVRILGNVKLPARAMVYDMTGRLVSTRTLNGVVENDVSLVNASSGVYFLKIESENKQQTIKFNWINN